MVKVPRRLRVESLETRRLLATLLEPPAPLSCLGHSHTPMTEVSVAVEAQNLSGLRGAEFEFRYETAKMDLDPQSIKLGSAWQGKASMVSNIDDLAGTIRIFVYSANPIASSAGELVELEFDVVDHMAADIASRVELMKFELNEGQIGSTPRLVFEADKPMFPPPRLPDPLPRAPSLRLPSLPHHPRPEHARPEHPLAEHPLAEHPRPEHPRPEHPLAEYPWADHGWRRHAGDETQGERDAAQREPAPVQATAPERTERLPPQARVLATRSGRPLEKQQRLPPPASVLFYAGAFEGRAAVELTELKRRGPRS